MLNQKLNALLNGLNFWENKSKEKISAPEPSGPTFVGTKKEFRRYVGPALRNLVQQVGRRHRTIIGACEHCNSTENLEAAHVTGKDRNRIFNQLLIQYKVGDHYQVNLREFEARFKEEHHPNKKSLLILCRSCHVKYDSLPIKEALQPEIKNKVEELAPSNKIYESISKVKTTNSRIFTKEEFAKFRRMKIGRLVRSTLPELIESGRVGATEFMKLQDSSYSKITFDVNYPVLKKVDENKPIAEQKMDKGYQRFYAKPEKSAGKRYLITKEWYDRNHEPYLRWLKKYVAE